MSTHENLGKIGRKLWVLAYYIKKHNKAERNENRSQDTPITMIHKMKKKFKN